MWTSGRQATLLPPPVESEPLFEALFFVADPDADSDFEPDFDDEPLLDVPLDPESDELEEPESEVVELEELSEELDPSLDEPADAPAVDFEDRLSFL